MELTQHIDNRQVVEPKPDEYYRPLQKSQSRSSPDDGTTHEAPDEKPSFERISSQDVRVQPDESMKYDSSQSPYSYHPQREVPRSTFNRQRAMPINRTPPRRGGMHRRSSFNMPSSVQQPYYHTFPSTPPASSYSYQIGGFVPSISVQLPVISNVPWMQGVASSPQFNENDADLTDRQLQYSHHHQQQPQQFYDITQPGAPPQASSLTNTSTAPNSPRYQTSSSTHLHRLHSPVSTGARIVSLSPTVVCPPFVPIAGMSESSSNQVGAASPSNYWEQQSQLNHLPVYLTRQSEIPIESNGNPQEKQSPSNQTSSNPSQVSYKEQSKS